MAREPVLIVEDNLPSMELARLVLTTAGFEVRTACDGEEALRVLESFAPRLILMDIQLPGLDGLALTRRLKGDPAHRHIVILALTAYAMRGDEQKARAAGCDGYITKPIDVERLAGVVADHLSRPAGTPSDGPEAVK
jgi:CheY-like chemotaxis protein